MDQAHYKVGLGASRELRPCAWRGSLLVVVQLVWTALALALAVHRQLWLKLPGEALLFAVMWRWFAVMHTAAHQAVFRGRRANDILGLLASVFALLPYHPWRKTHLGHHRWTGWTDHDPSLSFPSETDAPESLKRAMDFAWRMHLPFFSLYFIVGKLWRTGSPASITRAAGTAGGADLSWQQNALSYLVLAGGHALLFALLGTSYLVAMAVPVLAYLVTSDVVLLNQHSSFEQLVASPANPARPLPVLQHLQHTRSVLLPEALSRHVLLRFDWHELHHLFPAVPHYRLAALRPTLGALPNEVPVASWMRQAQRSPGHRLALSRTGREP